MTDGQVPMASERIADECEKRNQHCTIQAHKSNSTENQHPLKPKLQDSEVEEQDADFGQEQSKLMADDGAVGDVDRDILEADGDIGVVPTEAIACFQTNEYNECEGEEPGEEHYSIIPAPTFD